MRKNKLKIILMIMMIMILSSATVINANYLTDASKVTMTSGSTGEEGSYLPVNITLSGEDVITDVPAILYTKDGESRTLVPVNFIADQMGGYVSWNGESQEVKLVYNGDVVVMTIDEHLAYVNGSSVELPSGISPVLMTYNGITRTMVPVAFITEMFGMEAAWIPETYTVAINKPKQVLTDVYLDYQSKFPEIRFRTTGDVDVTSYEVNGSEVGGQDKIVIDLQNTELNLSESSLTLKDGSSEFDIVDNIFEIDKINLSQIENNPPKSRLEISLLSPKGYKVFYDYETEEIVVQLINTVNEINVERIFNADTVVIETSEYASYNVTNVNGKVVVDVVNSYLNVNDGEYTVEPFDGDTIDSISYSQFNGDEYYGQDSIVTRVAVDLGDDIEYEDIYTESDGQNIYVYIATEPLSGFEYTKSTNTSGVLNINLNDESSYSEDYDEDSNELEILIPTSKVDLVDLEIDYDDNIVESVEIDEKGSNYRIKIQLAEGTSYTELSKSNNTSKVQYSFVNYEIINSSNQDILVVIDPGHGGRDPGAVGSLITEKELNLEASLMLEKMLEEKGYRVYMTRDTDVYVDLHERADIANDLNADYFISVHINAALNTDAEGVEILYGDESMYGGMGLATSIQELMPSYTNALDRGISYRPELAVLRLSEMPAVLCELGFITNESEQAKLMKDSYMEKAVESILDGFEDFLD